MALRALEEPLSRVPRIISGLSSLAKHREESKAVDPPHLQSLASVPSLSRSPSPGTSPAPSPIASDAPSSTSESAASPLLWELAVQPMRMRTSLVQSHSRRPLLWVIWELSALQYSPESEQEFFAEMSCAVSHRLAGQTSPALSILSARNLTVDVSRTPRLKEEKGRDSDRPHGRVANVMLGSTSSPLQLHVDEWVLKLVDDMSTIFSLSPLSPPQWPMHATVFQNRIRHCFSVVNVDTGASVVLEPGSEIPLDVSQLGASVLMRLLTIADQPVAPLSLSSAVPAGLSSPSLLSSGSPPRPQSKTSGGGVSHVTIPQFHPCKPFNLHSISPACSCDGIRARKGESGRLRLSFEPRSASKLHIRSSRAKLTQNLPPAVNVQLRVHRPLPTCPTADRHLSPLRPCTTIVICPIDDMDAWVPVDNRKAMNRMQEVKEERVVKEERDEEEKEEEKGEDVSSRRTLRRERQKGSPTSISFSAASTASPLPTATSSRQRKGGLLRFRSTLYVPSRDIELWRSLQSISSEMDVLGSTDIADSRTGGIRLSASHQSAFGGSRASLFTAATEEAEAAASDFATAFLPELCLEVRIPAVECVMYGIWSVSGAASRDDCPPLVEVSFSRISLSAATSNEFPTHVFWHQLSGSAVCEEASARLLPRSSRGVSISMRPCEWNEKPSPTGVEPPRNAALFLPFSVCRAHHMRSRSLPGTAESPGSIFVSADLWLGDVDVCVDSMMHVVEASSTVSHVLSHIADSSVIHQIVATAGSVPGGSDSEHTSPRNRNHASPSDRAPLRGSRAPVWSRGDHPPWLDIQVDAHPFDVVFTSVQPYRSVSLFSFAALRIHEYPVSIPALHLSLVLSSDGSTSSSNLAYIKLKLLSVVLSQPGYLVGYTARAWVKNALAVLGESLGLDQ